MGYIILVTTCILIRFILYKTTGNLCIDGGEWDIFIIISLLILWLTPLLNKILPKYEKVGILRTTTMIILVLYLFGISCMDGFFTTPYYKFL